MPRGMLVIAKNGEKYDLSLEVLLYGRYCYGRGKGYSSPYEAHQGAMRWLEKEIKRHLGSPEYAKG